MKSKIRELIKENLQNKEKLEALIADEVLTLENVVDSCYFPVELFSILPPLDKKTALELCADSSFTPDASFIDNLVSSEDRENLLYFIKNFKTTPITVPIVVSLINRDDIFMECIGELILQDRMIHNEFVYSFISKKTRKLEPYLIENRDFTFQFFVNGDKFGVNTMYSISANENLWCRLALDFFDRYEVSEGDDHPSVFYDDSRDRYYSASRSGIIVPRDRILNTPFRDIAFSEEMLGLTLEDAILIHKKGKYFSNPDHLEIPLVPAMLPLLRTKSYEVFNTYRSKFEDFSSFLIECIRENTDTIYLISAIQDDSIFNRIVLNIIFKEFEMYKTLGTLIRGKIPGVAINSIIGRTKPPVNDEQFYEFLLKIAGRGGVKACNEYFTGVSTNPLNRKKTKTAPSNKDLFNFMVSGLFSSDQDAFEKAVGLGYSIDNFISDVTLKVSYREAIKDRYFRINRSKHIPRDELFKLINSRALKLSVNVPYGNDEGLDLFTYQEILENKLYLICNNFDQLCTLCRNKTDVFKYLLKDPVAKASLADFNIMSYFGWQEKEFSEKLNSLGVPFASIIPYMKNQEDILERSHFESRDVIRSAVSKDFIDATSDVDHINQKDINGVYILDSLEAEYVVARNIHSSSYNLKSNLEKARDRFGDTVNDLLSGYLNNKEFLTKYKLVGNRRNLAEIKEYLQVKDSRVKEIVQLEDLISNGRVKYSDISKKMSIFAPQLIANPKINIYIPLIPLDQLVDVIGWGIPNKILITRLTVNDRMRWNKFDTSLDNVEIKTVEARKINSDLFNLISLYGADRLSTVKLSINQLYDSYKADSLVKVIQQGWKFSNLGELAREPWFVNSDNIVAKISHKATIDQRDVNEASVSHATLEMLSQRLSGDFSRYVFIDKPDEPALTQYVRERGGIICTEEEYKASVLFNEEVTIKSGILSFKNLMLTGLNPKDKFNLIKLLEEKDPRFASIELKKVNLSELEVIHNFETMKETGVSLDEKDLINKFDIPKNYANNKRIAKSIVNAVAITPSLLEKYKKIIEVRDLICPSVEFDGSDFLDLSDPDNAKERFGDITLSELLKLLEVRDLVLNPEIRLFSNVGNKKSLTRVIKSAGSCYIMRDCWEMLRRIYSSIIGLREGLNAIVERSRDAGEDHLEDEEYIQRRKTLQCLELKLPEISAIDDISGIHSRATALSAVVKDNPFVVVSKRYFLTEEVSTSFAEVSGGYVPFFPANRGDLYDIGPKHGWCVHTARSYEEAVINNNSVLVGFIPLDKEYNTDNIVALANFAIDESTGRYYVTEVRWSKNVQGGGMTCAISAFPTKKVADYLTGIFQKENFRLLKEKALADKEMSKKAG